MWLEDVALSGRSSVDLKSEFVIMVSKAEWRKYPGLTATENGVETLSGNATGSSQKQIMISVDPVTDGKPRDGKIVFTTADSSKETCVIDILQAGN